MRLRLSAAQGEGHVRNGNPPISEVIRGFFVPAGILRGGVAKGI